MKSKIVLYPIIFLFSILCLQCTEIDEYKKYMPDGGIIYPQKPDSVKTFPGKNRIQLQWLLVDPKVTSCEVFYEQDGVKKSSLVNVNGSSYEYDTVKVIIPDLSETTYVFEIVSYDDLGNISVPVEAVESAYGELYEGTLLNRLQKSYSSSEEDGLMLEWHSATSTEIGIKLEYTSTNGNMRTIIVSNLETSTSIPDFDYSEPLYYSTMYQPVPTAIDTFYAEIVSAKYDQILDVALNKPTETSGQYNSAYPGSGAVDGVGIETSSRWISENDTTDHWIVIDLQGDYNVSGLKMFTGTGGNLNYPIQNFSFQIEVDGEWVDIVTETGNTNPEYETSFEPVSAKKIRLYVPAYADNLVRLYEIKVYAIL